MPHAATQLERALAETAAAMGVEIAILSSTAREWASATFIGARHRIAVTAALTEALDAWLVALPEIEFRLRGHLVADILVTARSEACGLVELEIEALTVEDV